MKAPSKGKKSGANAVAAWTISEPFSRDRCAGISHERHSRGRARARRCAEQSLASADSRERASGREAGSRVAHAGGTHLRPSTRRITIATALTVFQEGVACVFRAMSEHVGDRKGSAPFKEGTIKYACYEVLKHAGPRGLTVRPRVIFPARASLPPRAPPNEFKKLRARRGVEFSSLPPVPSFAPQVAEIVRHIRDGALAKLGGATPANTIVGQLSKGTRAFLLPSQRSPREKECVHPSLAPTALAYLLFLPNPSPSSQTPTSRSCARRRTRCAQVRRNPSCRLACRCFLARARARTPPRLLSARVPANSRTVHRLADLTNACARLRLRARARSRAELTSPSHPRLCFADAAAPESFVSERTGFQVRASSPPTPVLESRPASPKINQPRRCGRVASRRFP